MLNSKSLAAKLYDFIANYWTIRYWPFLNIRYRSVDIGIKYWLLVLDTGYRLKQDHWILNFGSK